ncbi:MAG: phage tail tape measure protein, partial [Culicoidibacterales bacterium]
MAVSAPPVEIPIKADNSDALAKLEKTWQEAKKVDDNVSKMNASFQKIEGAGDTLMRNVTLPLTGMATAAVTLSMSFEESFAKVSTLFGDTTVDTENLKSKILELSDATGVSANELNEGLYGALSAGIPVTEDMTEALQFMEQATQLSKAGFATSSDAVKILTGTMNAYGLEASEATRISDIFMEAQNKGILTIGELSAVLGPVIPAAAGANVGIEQLAASMAHLTSKSVPTAQAATQVKAMLNELSTTGSKTDKVLREQTGKSFSDLSAEGMNLADALAIVETNANENGLTLKDMFGSVEAASAAFIIAEGNGEDYKMVLDGMTDSAGNTASAFDIMNNTPMNKMKRELESLKNAGIELGAELIPVVLDIVESLGDMLRWFKELDPETQDMIIKGALLAAALGPVAKIVGMLGQAGTSVYSAFKGANTMLSGFKEVSKGVGDGLPVTNSSVGLLGKSMAFLGTAAGGAALGIGAMALALGVGIWKTVTTEQEALKTAIENTDGAVQTFYQSLKDGDDVVPVAETWVDKLAKVFGIENDSITAASESVNKHMENLAKNSGLTEDAQEIVKNYGTQFGILTEQMTLASQEQKVVTDEYGATMINAYQTATTGLLGEIATRHEQEIAKVNEKYTALGAVDSEAHKNELESLKIHYENSKSEVEVGMEKISSIYQTAWEENRALTEQETTLINHIVDANFVEGLITSMGLTGAEADLFRKKWSANLQEMSRDAFALQDNTRTATDNIIYSAQGVSVQAMDTKGKIHQLSLQTIDDKEFWISDDGTIQKSRSDLNGLINMTIPDKYYTVTEQRKTIGNGGHMMVDMNANGTRSFSGGLTTINERLYDEIIDLPSGSRIYSATQSQHMMDEIVKNNSRGGRSSSNNISIAFGDVRIDSDMDIKQIAKQLA